MSEFSKNLKKLRLSKDLTQTQLANVLGLSYSAISMYERGNREPDLETLELIADYFNVDMDFLTGRKEYLSTESVAFRIKTIMKYKGITIKDLAKLLGENEENLYDYIFKTPDNEFSENDPKLLRIARALNIENIDVFFGYTTFSDNDYENYIGFLLTKIDRGLPLTESENKIVLNYINADYCKDITLKGIKNIIPIPKMKKVPLLGTIACGEPILAVENIENYVNMPESINGTFALRCKGDSMINARIFDGDLVFIREQPDVENGEIAAVLIGDEATLKKVYKYNNRIELRPENPTMAPLEFEGEEISKIKILGKAVYFLSPVQ